MVQRLCPKCGHMTFSSGVWYKWECSNPKCKADLTKEPWQIAGSIPLKLVKGGAM